MLWHAQGPRRPTLGVESGFPPVSCPGPALGAAGGEAQVAAVAAVPSMSSS